MPETPTFEGKTPEASHDTSTPPELQATRFETIPIFDLREYRSGREENEDRRIVNQIFKKMGEKSEDLKDNPFIQDYKRKLEQRQERITSQIIQEKLKLTKPSSQRKENEKTIKKRISKLEKEYRQLPLLQLSEFAHEGQKIREHCSELTKLLREAKQDQDQGRQAEIEDEIQENQKTQATYNKRKLALLTHLIGDFIDRPEAKPFKRIIKNLLIGIQRTRKAQGRELYNNDAIQLFIHHAAYCYYLWQGELRKDGKTSYFLSHIVGAKKMSTLQGFTGAATLAALTGHDNFEDLSLHRANPNDMDSDITPRRDWFSYPLKIYINELDDPKNGARIEADIMDKAFETVKGVTKWFQRPDEAETQEERQERDEINLIEFYRGMSATGGHPATVRVVEQPQNFRTISNLPPHRQEPKIDEMTRNWIPIARNFEFWEIYYDMVNSLIKHYHPKLIGRFNAVQRHRIQERLKKTSPRRGMKTLMDLLLPKQEDAKRKKSLMDELDTWIETIGTPEQEVLQTRRDINQRIQATVAPFQDGIVSIDIIPTPLEHPNYIPDIEAIRKEDFAPQIPEDDPMFEILILVDDPSQIQDTAFKLLAHISPDSPSQIDPQKPEKGRPYRGVTLTFDDLTLGNDVKIRVNSVREEALSKRGIRVDPQNTFPDWLRRRIDHALIEVEHQAMTMSEAVDKIIGQPFITARCAIGTRKELRLQANGTFLDAAKAISKDTLIHAKSAYRQRRGSDGKLTPPEQVSLFDVVEEGDYLTIETYPHEEAPELDLAKMVFMEDPDTKHMAKRYYQRLNSEAIKKQAEKEITEEIERMESQLEVLKQEGTTIKEAPHTPENKVRIRSIRTQYRKIDKKLKQLKNDLAASQEIQSLQIAQQESSIAARTTKRNHPEDRKLIQAAENAHKRATQKLKQARKKSNNILKEKQRQVQQREHQKRGRNYLHDLQTLFSIGEDHVLPHLALQTLGLYPSDKIQSIKYVLERQVDAARERENQLEEEPTIDRELGALDDESFERLIRGDLDEASGLKKLNDAVTEQAKKAAKEAAPSKIGDHTVWLLLREDPKNWDKIMQRTFRLDESSSMTDAERRKLELLLNDLRKEYKKANRETLTEIGNGNFNPLKTLAPYINQEKEFEITIVTDHDQLGVIGAIGMECKQEKISIDNYGSPKRDSGTGKSLLTFTLKTGEKMSNYELLKFILKLQKKYDGWEVCIDREIIKFGKTTKQLRIAGEIDTQI